MTKHELICHLAEANGISQRTAKKTLNTIIACLTDNLVAGNRIEIRGFGTFKSKAYKGFTGKNPKTGETVVVNPKKVPRFRMGKELKERVNP